MNRRRLLRTSKRASYIYLGDTPVLPGNNNSSNFATITQPSNAIFNYILVISKDRNAYKQLTYTQDQLSSKATGKVAIKAVPNYAGYASDDTTMFFTIGARTDKSELTFSFNRGTGGTGNFFTFYPQAYEVYGLIDPYEEGDIT